MTWNRIDVRRVLRFFVVVAAFAMIFLITPRYTYADESSCISCHTSTKKLLEVIREIEASNPKIEASTESEGEG